MEFSSYYAGLRFRILDTFDMALIGHILNWYLVSNYGNPLSLQNPIW